MGQSESTTAAAAAAAAAVRGGEKSRSINSEMKERGGADDDAKEAGGYYKLDLASMDDDLFQCHIPAKDWIQTTTKVDKSGFKPNSLNQLKPISKIVEIERICGIALYMAGNVLPFIFPPLLVGSIFSSIARYILGGLMLYIGILYAAQFFYFTPYFVKLYKNQPLSSKTTKANQYIYTERNISKYLSIQFVWPTSVHRPALVDTPVIFCVIPHGVAPLGIVSYPLWSKVWNDKLCHFTAAPVVMKIPLVSYYLRMVGYIPAKAKNITETLTKKEENIGIILDGIEGMFATEKQEEVAAILRRKGIIKIALRAGVPIIPVYGFGHTQLYTVFQDPFGILKALSIALDTALTPFFGRFGWFLGPPYRRPVTMCLGEPVHCPLTAEPTQADVDSYHKQLLNNFEQVFEQHKAACGYGDKKLKFV